MHNSSQPGGCELGPRPIDLHLSSLEKLGVDITEDHGYLDCKLRHPLCGAVITLPFPSVGATENIILAACTAKGDTVIHNPAREPEIEDLIGFLNKAGANISVREGGSIYIRGVSGIGSAEYSIIPDRIAAATYLCCAAITRGSILLRGVMPGHMTAIFPILEEMGCTLRIGRGEIHLASPRRLKPLRLVRTMPYPGFPTDTQAPLMSVSCLSEGTSVFVENIFESRYKHACELTRMGARISVEGRVAVVEGVGSLHGAAAVCTDLRGGASLVVAALAANGQSKISEITHIERGYQDFDKNLSSLGAKIDKGE
ncbi:MAG: UDP-N-acetylglucosamine 1-carboxyvinyltransferase [Oscillospiraceae bacterium]|nr:UDP-N-acetylglucosamine 1-carboxyvinyltransferase [Oscillospiraceae bacterium]